MTETINRYQDYEVVHSTFGGLIYVSDFNTEYTGIKNQKRSRVAERIISDFTFDKQCKKNIDGRIRNVKTN